MDGLVVAATQFLLDRVAYKTISMQSKENESEFATRNLLEPEQTVVKVRAALI